MAAEVILEITNALVGITRSLLLYRLLQLVSFPFIVCYFIARLISDRGYRPHFRERLGFLPGMFKRTEAGAIWLHAVSVGEVVSAIPLIRQLRSERPKVPLYLSTSTVAGRQAADRQAGALVNGIFYAPIDYVCCVRRVLRAIRPALLVILETEIWPNLYAETKRTGAGLAIVNGRISDRTWPRYFSARRFFCPVLSLADAVMVQSGTDYNRYAELGVAQERLENAGNLKYDAALPEGTLNLPTFGAQHIWIAASTVGPREGDSAKGHPVDEDDIVIRTFQQLVPEFPNLLLILAPRQPARFEEVAEKLKVARIPFVRRTELEKDAASDLKLPGVMLLNTVGELSGTYPLADVVFVGGSIARRGGHNILEPAAAGAAIIVGPHMENFQAIVGDFKDASAIVQLKERDELVEAVRMLLLDGSRAKSLGSLAKAVVFQKNGAAGRVSERLWRIYYAAQIRQPRTLVAFLLLRALAAVWIGGGRWKRQRAERIARLLPPLPVPVISIGGITLGGSGKTPFTKYLADQFRERGYSPAILTRGYRRRSPAQSLVFGAGAEVPAAFTGDEAQIFLRAANAPIGIGADRYRTARILLASFPETSILLLDDGFQHARLARDVDVVVIDGLDSFGGRAVVPLGRLREPLDALKRADIFVVTRAENLLRFEAIRARLKELNADAPAFRTRLIARRWRDYYTGAPLDDLGKTPVAAFCGLGNPRNFWDTLESLNLEVVFRWAFGDHHVYTQVEIQRLAHQARAHGATVLVTTEKDRINLPPKLEVALKEMTLGWLEIDLELEDEIGFFAAVNRLLERPAEASGETGHLLS